MRQGLSLASRLSFIVLLFVESVAGAGEPEWKLTIKPQKCVALRQGNVCYQDIVIKWQAPEKGRYCIYLKDEKLAIKCWKNVSSGKLGIEFHSASSQSYLLRRNGNNTNLLTTIIEVKWVYRNKRNTRSGWRVF